MRLTTMFASMISRYVTRMYVFHQKSTLYIDGIYVWNFLIGRIEGI